MCVTLWNLNDLSSKIYSLQYMPSFLENYKFGRRPIAAKQTPMTYLANYRVRTVNSEVIAMADSSQG